MIDLVVANQGGTPLGARFDGNVPRNSLGALLQERGKPRPLATYLAAIAVCEDLIDYEDLGRGPNRGVWLFPAEGGSGMVIRPRETPAIEGVTREIDHGLFTQQTVSHLLAAAAQDLRNLATRLAECKIVETRVFTFELGHIRVDAMRDFSDRLKSWSRNNPNSHFIYSMFADTDETAMRCKDAFAAAKVKDRGNRKFARFNESEGSRTLYVGRSADITSRMAQHFGFSYPGIYSLQMSSWCRDLSGSILIEVLCLDAQAEDDVVQAIEDFLWFTRRPAFGRRGAR